MKHSIAFKFLAILLAACALVTAAIGAFGIVLLGTMDLYAAENYTQWREQELTGRAQHMAHQLVQRYAVGQYSDCPASALEEYLICMRAGTLDSWVGLEPDSYSYTIQSTDGVLLASGGIQQLSGITYTDAISASYPVLTGPDTCQEGWYIAGQELYIRYVDSPEYLVSITVTTDSMTSYNGLPVEYIDWLFQIRYWLILFLAAGLLVFAICAVYLCYAAGRSKHGEQLMPGGLNRLPLDLYLALAGSLCVLLVALALRILDAWVLDEALNLGALALAVTLFLIVAVIGVGFCFAAAAQAKMRHFYWWKHTVIGWLLTILWRGIRFLGKALARLLGLLPLIWQYLLTGAAMGFFPLLFFYLASTGRDFWAVLFFLSVFCDLVIVCYGGYAYGTLLAGAKRMAAGNLHVKIPTRYLLGPYKRCAVHLNDLANVATVAAKNQMRSERMKTELITNVSHDIKTPLTSIINYVDLLQKAPTEEQSRQYLEVLGRQSLRLKKLIEDLMEMSKATTGNMAVDITWVDAAEAITQALGEFSDKLAAAQLIPVFHQPEQAVAMQADGRLTWRVLSNLLSNIVKYALPGTRVYIDLVRLEDQVLISLKNISREALNVSAEELTERFVRGDASRNTDGSGLGLNIAKSLMELQGGQLQLLVDGDLFKVTLIFPADPR